MRLPIVFLRSPNTTLKYIERNNLRRQRYYFNYFNRLTETPLAAAFAAVYPSSGWNRLPHIDGTGSVYLTYCIHLLYFGDEYGLSIGQPRGKLLTIWRHFYVFFSAFWHYKCPKNGAAERTSLAVCFAFLAGSSENTLCCWAISECILMVDGYDIYIYIYTCHSCTIKCASIFKHNQAKFKKCIDIMIIYIYIYIIRYTYHTC